MFAARLLLAALLSTTGGAAAHSAVWTVYSYTASIGANTLIDSTSFTAGSLVTGQVYVRQGIAPGNDGWGFAGEVARYADSVNSFSFSTAGLAFEATGAGDTVVHNNRRLTAGGTAFKDIFSASVGNEPASNFTSTILGDGVIGVGFDLSTPHVAPVSSATTSIALPSSVNPALFTEQRLLFVNFVDGSRLEATITGMTVSSSTALPVSTPEPSTAAVLALGLAGLGMAGRRRAAGQAIGAAGAAYGANASRT